ncbi:related to calcium-binding protein caleosin [Rhynchosporium graminicola]|uniref:Related to calcium-binding protein caleosin n=1 Tax=Rhynchosporium graminicola TaxID=2792576 RepID=A0A1E1KDS7_9HELO|nr:related to calcium-binding protein caleosin [Rhynchosporium commune]
MPIPSSQVLAVLILGSTISYFWGYFKTSTPDTCHQPPSKSADNSKSSNPSSPTPDPNLTALQQHVLFWDRDRDNIIYPHDVYTGFRSIGFSIPFSLTALLIPVFFSYPTRLGHSYIPDPLFRIYLKDIHKAKHGSDTGIYDLSGNLRGEQFEGMFREFDTEEKGGVSARELWRMVGRNRVAADVAGWTFAAMEWSTTWLLLQREGRVWREDLRECYDGSLFWRLQREREEGVKKMGGYGFKEGWEDLLRLVGGKKGKPIILT